MATTVQPNTVSTAAPARSATSGEFPDGTSNTEAALAAAQQNTIAQKYREWRYTLMSGGEIRDTDLLGAPVTVGKRYNQLDPSYDPTSQDQYTIDRRSVGELLDDLPNMGQDELSILQTRMMDAGYASADSLDLGNPFDVKTRAAFGALLADGAAYSDRTLDDLLQPRDKAKKGSGGGGGGALRTVTLTDSAQIREYADQIATSVLGRLPTDAEKERYVAVIHAAEAAQQGGRNAAADSRDAASSAARAAGNTGYLGSSSVTTEDVNPAARLTEQIRADNQAEAGAHDIGNQWDAFTKLIGHQNREVTA